MPQLIFQEVPWHFLCLPAGASVASSPGRHLSGTGAVRFPTPYEGSDFPRGIGDTGSYWAVLDRFTKCKNHGMCELEKMAMSTIFFTPSLPSPSSLTMKTWDVESVMGRNEGWPHQEHTARIVVFFSRLMTWSCAERDPESSKAPGRRVWGQWSLASNAMIPLTWLPGGYLNSRNSPNRTGPAMTWSPESLDSALLGRFREICLSFSFNLFSVSGFREGKRWKSQLDSTATTGMKGSSKGVLIPNDHWQLSHHPTPASLLFLFLLLLENGS